MTAAAPVASPDPRRWKAMPIVALAVSIVIMDATVVNVVLPVLIRKLSLTSADAEWVNSIYALVFAALLITTGRVGDRFGRRRLLVVGIVVFGAGSILAALATGAPALLAARLVQGLGGAAILPATLSTVNALFSGRERGIAFAIWGSTIGGMAAVGPVVGGWLTTAFSWQWAFLINIPVVIVVLVGALIWVPETKDDHATRGADVLGVVLSVVGLSAIVFGLIEGQRFGWWTSSANRLTLGSMSWQWTISPVPIAFLIGVVGILLFVIYERSRIKAGRPTLADLRLFAIRSFRYGSIAALVVALGEFGMLFALPLFLQGSLGYTALNTGLVILALAIGTFLSSGVTPQLTNRIGARGVVRVGLLLEALAILGLGLSVGLGVNGWTIAGWLFLYGIGVGMATAQLTGVILAEVPVNQSGQASGLQSTVRQLGSALGVALLGTLLITTLATALASGLAAHPTMNAAQQANVVSVVQNSAGAVIPQLDHLTGQSGVQAIAQTAMVTATRATVLTAAGVILLGLLATLALPRVDTPRQRDAGVEIGPEASTT
ncbi:MAG: MFS transporter [Acidobacteria bacterium]|nr:MFS transporter [Acidobacteriota bacterium]